MRVRDVVARRVQEVRQAQGLTLRELAARMAAIGATPAQASGLARIEKRTGDGREGDGRGVTVEELAALAYVLGVTPASLMTTRADADEAVIVSRNVDPIFMGDWRPWVCGRDPLPGVAPASTWPDGGPISREAMTDAASVVFGKARRAEHVVAELDAKGEL